MAATETDTGLPLTWRRLVALVPAQEIDSAFPLSRSGEVKINLTPAVEIDSAVRIFIVGAEPPALSPLVRGPGEGRIAEDYDGGVAITTREQGGRIGRDLTGVVS